MKKISFLVSLLGMALLVGCVMRTREDIDTVKKPVDYVNPYMGNISHLLVPTFPTVHLPNSMLRVYPERADYTSDLLNGLPVVVTSHRGSSAFNLSPSLQEEYKPVVAYSYDNEVIKPYYYSVRLEDEQIDVEYAPSHQSALYSIKFGCHDKQPKLFVNSRNGAIRICEGNVSGYQRLANNTQVYLYMETDVPFQEAGILKQGKVEIAEKEVAGENACAVLRFPAGTAMVNVRYGISFISEEQAEKNLKREIEDYDIARLAEQGRDVWNTTLGKIEVDGGSEDEKSVFYTSLYRVFERPVCISEDGNYFSAFDGKVHEDDGTPFYTDDWIWDTYRAAHPLRLLLDETVEKDIIESYLRMAEQMGNLWMPTFPEITGDSRRMNSNHAVATVADAAAKGLQFDLEKAYMACRKGIEEKTLAPWSGAPAGWIDDFYKKNGYIPALQEGEQETDPNVHPFEKRQPIAVTLGTSYDQWCLSRIADMLGKKEDAAHYLKCAYNYRNVYNDKTAFFHPKDKNGKWIEPFDYRFAGGMGAREYYGENNGWVYRWDVPHNVADLIDLMGGSEQFIANLDQTFSESLGRSKYAFYAQLPDHTGNVGQFSMANEPSMHVPYLYNYAGRPWKTQKRIRQLLGMWFRNDLMGMPGDEDGGGMSAFVAFSALGFYPVTPGMPAYNIGSPIFNRVRLTLSNGKIFEIEAQGASTENKYIQSATLNGRSWNKPWFEHDDIKNGGKLVLVMGKYPNKAWGTAKRDVPPSAEGFLNKE